MFKKILMLMTIIGLSAFSSKADDPIGFVVPYQVKCVKNDAGDLIRKVSILLHTKADDTLKNPFTVNGTGVLQTKDSCDALNIMFDEDGKLWNKDATKVFEGGFPEVSTEYCVFFMDVTMRKKSETDLEFAQKLFDVNDDDVFVWLDLDHNGTDITSLNGTVFETDDLLTSGLKDNAINLSITKFHNNPCCVETFGLSPENASALLCEIVHKAVSCSGDFSGHGTISECGKSSSVKITGTKSSKIKIKICGKKFLLEGQTNDDGLDFATCVCLLASSAAAFASFYGRPDFCEYGVNHELDNLIMGYELDGIFYQYRFLCLNDKENLYAVAIFIESTDLSTVNIQGTLCQFKLTECK